MDMLRDLARPETTEEARERKIEDAKRMNAIREAEGLRPIYTPETVPDTNITGIKLIDDGSRGILRGWKAASDPEFLEKRRRENDARIEALTEQRLRDLKGQ